MFLPGPEDKKFSTASIILLFHSKRRVVCTFCLLMHCLCVWRGPVRLFVTPWTAACQAPLSMAFSRQEYWSGLPFPPPGDLPNSEIEPVSPVAPTLAGRLFSTEPPGKCSLLTGL